MAHFGSTMEVWERLSTEELVIQIAEEGIDGIPMRLSHREKRIEEALWLLQFERYGSGATPKRRSSKMEQR